MIWKRFSLGRRWRLYPKAVPVFLFEWGGSVYRIWVERNDCQCIYEHVGDLLISDKVTFAKAVESAIQYLARYLHVDMEMPFIPYQLGRVSVGRCLYEFHGVLDRLVSETLRERRKSR